MASLDKTAQEFEEKQMKQVDVLYSPDKDELTPGELVDVGVISDKVREKIEKVLPSAGDVFKKVMKREKNKLPNAMGDAEREKAFRAAFRQAFKEVYGKFIFESVSVDEDLAKTLNVVLKTQVVGNGDHLKGRPELQAAILELHSIQGFVEASKDEYKNKFSALESARGVIKTQIELLNVDSDATIDSIEANYGAAVDLLKDREAESADIEHKEETRLKALVDSFNKDHVDDVNKVIKEFFTTLEDIPKSIQGVPANFMRDFIAILNEWRSFAKLPTRDANDTDSVYFTKLHSHYDDVLQKISDDVKRKDFYKFSEYGDVAFRHSFKISFKHAIDGFLAKGGLSSNIADYAKGLEKLTDEEKKSKRYIYFLKQREGDVSSGPHPYMGELKILFAAMENMKKYFYALGDLHPSVQKIFITFETEYNTFLASPDSKDKEKVSLFLYRLVNEFLAPLGPYVKNLDGKRQKALERLKNEFSEKDKEIAGLKEITDNGFNLGKFFGDVFPVADSKKLEVAKTEMRNAEDRLKEAKESKEYFLKKNAVPNFNAFRKNLGALLGITEEPKTEEPKTKEPKTEEPKTEEPKKASLIDMPIISSIAKLKSQIESAMIQLNIKREENKKSTVTGLTSEEHEKLRNEVAVWKQELRELEDLSKKCIEIHGSLKSFIAQASSCVFDDNEDLKEICVSFESIDPTMARFKALELFELLKKLSDSEIGKIFNSNNLDDIFNSKIPSAEEAVSDARRNVIRIEKTAKANSDLSDAEAAKKIMIAVVREQMPDLSPEDVEKLAKAQLIDAMETLKNGVDYENLAARGSGKLFELIRKVGLGGRFKSQVLDFQYKFGDKLIKPLDGLSTGDIEDWPKIEHLFEIGRLDMEKGIYLLAGIAEVAEGKNTEVYPKLRKHLLAMVAEELGIEDRLHEAPMMKIAEKALSDHLRKLKPLYSDHIAKCDETRKRGKNIWGEGVAERSLIKSFKLRIDKLNEEYKTGEIDRDDYKIGFDEVLAEAEGLGIRKKVQSVFGLSHNKFLSSFRYSPVSQWLRDAAYYGAGRGKTVLTAGAKMAGLGLWGATKLAAKSGWAFGKVPLKGLLGGVKLGASLTKQTILTPFRLAKYPLMLAAKPLIGFYNFFRKTEEEWHPYNMRETFKADVGRVMGYTKDTISSTYTGAKDAVVSATKDTGAAFVSTGSGIKATVSTVPVNEWKKFSREKSRYKNRGPLFGEKVELDKLTKKIEKLKARGTFVPVQTWIEFKVNFDSYKKEIDKLDANSSKAEAVKMAA